MRHSTSFLPTRVGATSKPTAETRIYRKQLLQERARWLNVLLINNCCYDVTISSSFIYLPITFIKKALHVMQCPMIHSFGSCFILFALPLRIALCCRKPRRKKRLLRVLHVVNGEILMCLETATETQRMWTEKEEQQRNVMITTFLRGFNGALWNLTPDLSTKRA